MSTVSGLQNTPSPVATGTGSITGKQVMGKEEFLKLLVTQLKNQDPSNPMNGQEFAAQLAQFSSVEQLVNIESALAAQAQSQSMLAQSMNSGMAAGLIGKHVQADSNTFHYSGSGNSPVRFDLAGAAESVRITVYDRAGRPVREWDAPALSAGMHEELVWDGRNAAGTQMPGGDYSFTVKAVDAKGNNIDVRPVVDGRIDRVTFGPEGLMLWIGNTSVSLAAIRTIDGQ